MYPGGRTSPGGHDRSHRSESAGLAESPFHANQRELTDLSVPSPRNRANLRLPRPSRAVTERVLAVEILTPDLDLLHEEYVLVQAFKKTADHLRYHNWYANTLEIDLAAVDLPRFIGRMAERLRGDEPWHNRPARLVLAPKSAQWRVSADGPSWRPTKSISESDLRPLAHLALEDQVVSTAVMMCLADRVETAQGDPRKPFDGGAREGRVISLGNRLFCDNDGGRLRFRWGSGHFYRGYFQDYQTFIARPERSAELALRNGRVNAFVVQTDLRQFYDRVSPDLLNTSLRGLARPGDDARFFEFAAAQLSWRWHAADRDLASRYADQDPPIDFEMLTLPQGLASAGFFANVALLDFDERLRAHIGEPCLPEFPRAVLEDVARYVDDMRIVFSLPDAHEPDTEKLKNSCLNWLDGVLESTAPGLIISESKSRVAFLAGDRSPLVRQSRRMARLQHAVSQGFSADEGVEIVQSLLGLIRTQEQFARPREDDGFLHFSPVPDVPDATVARFAAGRFRRTFRSLRPLLEPAGERGAVGFDEEDPEQEAVGLDPGAPWTRRELDEEAQAYALNLLDSWLDDPSNVRLLRIALDLWPSTDVLDRALRILRPFTESPDSPGPEHRVAWYCLSEVFRAGATESGYVEYGEMLPDAVDVGGFRERLLDEARRIIEGDVQGLPWYLRQQALLFVAVQGPERVALPPPGDAATADHRRLIRFLTRDFRRMSDAQFAINAILAWSSVGEPEAAVEIALDGITSPRLAEIMSLSPEFGGVLAEARPDLLPEIPRYVLEDLGLLAEPEDSGWNSLSDLVLHGGDSGGLRDELHLLRLAKLLLPELGRRDRPVVTPSMVLLAQSTRRGIGLREVSIPDSGHNRAGSIFEPPVWVSADDRWRFQLGYLLRFVLSRSRDFTHQSRQYRRRYPTGWNYRPPESHWYLRHHGFFSAQAAFGQDWLPISEWTENFLFTLLRWPGSRLPAESSRYITLRSAHRSVRERLQEIESRQRGKDAPLIIPIRTTSPNPSAAPRPLRVAVAQTVIPKGDDFTLADMALDDPVMRRRHQGHLRATLAALRSMLRLRATHSPTASLDLLVLPELAIHPADVRHLVDFARSQHTIVLAGLTYERLTAQGPLVNSALWVVPSRSTLLGLTVRTYRQGKRHLAPLEAARFPGQIGGFRPAQLLIGYDWSNQPSDPPLWLSAAVCYDATDLSLVAALRDQSDVFLIPALNQDVQTFDQMALALHYHMYQLVVIANNGGFGGSNAYAPYAQRFESQVFHLHGNDAASIAFLELPDVAEFLARKDTPARPLGPPNPAQKHFKSPPAGLL